MARLPKNIDQDYMTPLDAGRIVGVNRQRIMELIADERICEVFKTSDGYKTTPVQKVFGGWRIPNDFRILRAIREKDGAVKDYIEAWEAAHPEVLRDEREKARVSVEQNKERLAALKSRENTPVQARGSFLGPAH